MRSIPYKQLVQLLGGKTLRYPSAYRPQGMLNYGQSRSLRNHHTYFVPANQDWNRHLQAIRSARPHLIFVATNWPASRLPGLPFGIGVVAVPNPYQAFFRAAKWSYQPYKPQVIGITGSAGKSTTTAMVHAMLRPIAPLVRTYDNLNTVLFLPRYLSQVGPLHRYLLLEMGMNSRGDISGQCRIVRPHVGVVTNVGEAHIGKLGGLQQVAQAKQELVEGMRPGGRLFLNADDPGTRRLTPTRSAAKVITFGIHAKQANLRASHVRYTVHGMSFVAHIEGKHYAFQIPIYGEHNVYNALAAIGVGRSLGISIPKIQHALRYFHPPRMRLQPLIGRRGEWFINDAWNANPAAMIAGLQVLAKIGGKRAKIAVLGDMLELGAHSRAGHERVGKYIARTRPAEHLILIGPQSQAIARAALQHGFPRHRIRSVPHTLAAAAHIKQLPAHAVVYCKASRKLHLEYLLRPLLRASRRS